MSISRRAAILAGIGGLSAAMLVGPTAAANDYPTGPVTMIVPFAPGGSTDPVARAFAEKMQEAWGVNVIVDNRPGAGGAVGGTALVSSEPDGYTLLVVNPGPAVLSVLLSQDPPYSPDDLEPIVHIGSMPQIAIVRSDFPADNMTELLEYAEENNVLWGSSGVNSSPHVALELLKQSTGANITHVPYGGSGPAVTDLLGGSIHAMYSTVVTSAGLIQSGDVKVLAVAGPDRQSAIPDVPTLAEQGIEDADMAVWLGIVAPKGTPPEILEKINADINEAIASPDLQETIFVGLNPIGGSVEEFRDFVQNEVRRVQALIDEGLLEPQ